MSSDQNRWVNYSVVVLILALLVAAFYGIRSQFEWVNMTINKGYTPEAARNRYLAAQHYLQQHSLTTKTAIDLTEIWDQLESQDAVLLLNNRVVPEAYHQQLMNWVADGGHLIITAQNLWDEEYQDSGDTLLDNLGVHVHNVIDEHAEEIGQAAAEKVKELAEEAGSDSEATINEDEEEAKTEANQCDAYGYSRLTLVDYSEALPPIQVQFGSYNHLVDAAGSSLAPYEYYPNQMLQYAIGQGKITTITNHSMWHNYNIGWYDHAYFLWLLVENAQNVWFVFDRQSESLLALITQHLLEPLIAGLLLLALYLWYRAKRFGPIAQEPPKGRRSLLEHITANGRFNWRHQQMQPLIQKQRDDIKHRFIRRHGNHHNEDSVITTLAKASELTPDQIRWALTCEAPEREQEFTQLIRLLQRLRNAV